MSQISGFGGITPPSKEIKMEPVPCKCGIKHEYGDGNYEAHYIKMTADDSPVQLPLKRVSRCKHCKEVPMTRRAE